MTSESPGDLEMDDPSPTWSSRWRIGALCACVLLTVLALISYGDSQEGREYGPDEGTYSYVGWAWGHGEWPYLDSWDHKGAPVYGVTLLRSLLAGGPEPGALGHQELVLGGAMAIMIGVIAHMLWGGLGFGLGLFFGVVLWTRGGPANGHMSTPGSIIGLLTAAAIASALASRYRTSFSARAGGALLVGATGGLAFCTKPNALSGLALGLLLLLTSNQVRGWRARLGLVGFTALGAIVPIAVVAIIFNYGSALGEMLDACINFNQIRGRSILAGVSPLTLARNVKQSLESVDLLAPLVAILAVSVHASWSAWTRRDGSGGLESSAVVILWLAAELAILVSNGGYTHHTYTVLPAAALGCAWVVSAPIAGSRRGVPISLALFSLLAIPALLEMRQADPSSDPETSELDRLVAIVKETTNESDRILVPFGWEGTALLCRTQRLSASRYTYPIPLYTAGYANDDRWRELVDIIEGATPPALIVIPGELRDVPSGQQMPRRLLTKEVFPHQARFIGVVSEKYLSERIGQFGLYRLRTEPDPPAQKPKLANRDK